MKRRKTKLMKERKMNLMSRAAAALSVMLVMSMWPAASFAAGASDTPDPASLQVQNAAGEHGNTATVTLGKILTVARADDFPKVSDFVFSIEAIRAWDNANVNTAESGEVIPAAEMPMPAAVSTAHRAVTVNGTKATVQVGDFENATAANHSAGYGADTATRRTRTAPVDITFAKAGYYLYKVREVGSIPENTADNYAVSPVKTVPGVDYDDNEYFMVFYVCNRIDQDGNTTDGVYVHSITSFTNSSGSETYTPNLTDIQNVTDNAGRPAGENTGQVNKDGTVTHALGKVGVSDSKSPNRLEAYRMWNAYVSSDLVLKKNVTGNLGDRTKEFEFTVSLTGLEKSKAYTTSAAAEDTGDVSSVQIAEVTVGTKKSGQEFSSNSSGEATLLVKMKDDDVFVINGLPMTAQYVIREAASDHVAKYEITSSNPSQGSDKAVIAKAGATNGTASDKALATVTETADRYDKTVTVLFTNNRDLAAITGVPGMDYLTYAGAALLAALAAAAYLHRRNRYED